MNNQIYQHLKSEYDSFYSEIMRKGKLPMWSTQTGFWNASLSDEIFAAFKKLNLNEFKNFLDLGSGDGKVTMLAGLFCENAEGVEIDPMLHLKAIEVKNKFNARNVHFHNKDFMHHDLKDYDAIFISPDAPLERGVERKLLQELNGKLILFGNHFHPKILQKEKGFRGTHNLVAVYSNLK